MNLHFGRAVSIASVSVTHCVSSRALAVWVSDDQTFFLVRPDAEVTRAPSTTSKRFLRFILSIVGIISGLECLELWAFYFCFSYGRERNFWWKRSKMNRVGSVQKRPAGTGACSIYVPSRKTGGRAAKSNFCHRVASQNFAVHPSIRPATILFVVEAAVLRLSACHSPRVNALTF